MIKVYICNYSKACYKVINHFESSLCLCCSLPSPQNLRRRFANLKTHVPDKIKKKGFSGIKNILFCFSVSDERLCIVELSVRTLPGTQ